MAIKLNWKSKEEEGNTIGDALGISKERQDEIATLITNATANFVEQEDDHFSSTDIAKKIEEVCKATSPEEVAFIFYGIHVVVQKAFELRYELKMRRLSSHDDEPTDFNFAKN